MARKCCAVALAGVAALGQAVRSRATCSSYLVMRVRCTTMHFRCFLEIFSLYPGCVSEFSQFVGGSCSHRPTSSPPSMSLVHSPIFGGVADVLGDPIDVCAGGAGHTSVHDRQPSRLCRRKILSAIRGAASHVAVLVTAPFGAGFGRHSLRRPRPDFQAGHRCEALRGTGKRRGLHITDEIWAVPVVIEY